MNGPWMKKDLSIGFDAAVDKLPAALKAEGFGVLTEIDMQATLKAKLGVEHRRHRIFGACHPPSAHRAVGALPEVGTLLPCNVTLFEADDGRAVMTAVDPRAIMSQTAHPALVELANEVAGRLERVLASM